MKYGILLAHYWLKLVNICHIQSTVNLPYNGIAWSPFIGKLKKKFKIEC